MFEWKIEVATKKLPMGDSNLGDRINGDGSLSWDEKASNYVRERRSFLSDIEATYDNGDPITDPIRGQAYDGFDGIMISVPVDEDRGIILKRTGGWPPEVKDITLYKEAGPGHRIGVKSANTVTLAAKPEVVPEPATPAATHMWRIDVDSKKLQVGDSNLHDKILGDGTLSSDEYGQNVNDVQPAVKADLQATYEDGTPVEHRIRTQFANDFDIFMILIPIVGDRSIVVARTDGWPEDADISFYKEVGPGHRVGVTSENTVSLIAKTAASVMKPPVVDTPPEQPPVKPPVKTPVAEPTPTEALPVVAPGEPHQFYVGDQKVTLSVE